MRKRKIKAIVHSNLGNSVRQAMKEYRTAHPDASAAELREIIDVTRNRLEARLKEPLDLPSWGPSEPKETRTDAQNSSRFSARIFSGDRNEGNNSPPANADSEISRLLEASERFYRFRSLYGIAFVLGVAAFSLAMVIDYQIMAEFWTRALANQFLEVPASLANSIFFKSMQVVIATIAFHFFLTTLSIKARNYFVFAFFILCVFMVAGFGFLNLHQTESAFANNHVQEAWAIELANDPFSGFGIGEETVQTEDETIAQAAVVGPGFWTGTVEVIRNFFVGIRQAFDPSGMIAPAVAFLVITAVGALCLQKAEENAQNFIKARDFKFRKARMDELQALEQSEEFLDSVFLDTKKSEVLRFRNSA